MAVRQSHAQEVSRLLSDLASGDVTRRTSASARLAVIGSRAVDGLIRVAADPALDLATRAAALASLSAIGDLRAVPAALAVLERREAALLGDAIDLAGWAVDRDSADATTAVDRLTALALDARAHRHHRRAAVAALGRLPPRIVAPLYKAIREVHAASRSAADLARDASGDPMSLADMVERGLPDDASEVDAVLRREWREAALTTMRRLVDATRAREAQATEGQAPDWLATRGRIHQAIAERGSRVALDDLRDAIAKAERPLPVGFLGAAARVGDATCLEAIAAAWLRTTPIEGRLWRTHLSGAFGTIVQREGLTRDHRTLVRILTRSPDAGVLVAKAAKVSRAATKRSRRATH